MAENKNTEKDETPKMKVLDRRHWVDENEESNDEDTPTKPIEEREALMFNVSPFSTPKAIKSSSIFFCDMP